MKDTLLEKISNLPPDKQKEIKDFIDYLTKKYLTEIETTESLSTIRQRSFGRLKGKIWRTDLTKISPLCGLFAVCKGRYGRHFGKKTEDTTNQSPIGVTFSLIDCMPILSILAILGRF